MRALGAMLESPPPQEGSPDIKTTTCLNSSLETFSMRNLLLMRRPLPRTLLVSLHLLVQLGMLVGGGLWTREALAPLALTSLSGQWPTLLLGVGVTLSGCLLVRMLFELLMMPHHMQSMIKQQQLPFTRSTRRRPAIHDEDDSWVGEARKVDPAAPEHANPTTVAPAEHPLAAAPPQAAAPAWSMPREPQLDLAATSPAGEEAPRGEPRF
ncbi:hypothetical protein [Onishia niordana]|uniref:hypothetical protein n=1 Tax=Onishia niordana TaxID=2508711 RepID=UPI00109FE26F|nr:hypothetical protein [Halomonas niordiana]